jgi:predicted membrane protein
MKRIIDSFYTLMIQHVSLNTLSLLLVFHITLIYLFFENKIWYNTVIKPNKNINN